MSSTISSKLQNQLCAAVEERQADVARRLLKKDGADPTMPGDDAPTLLPMFFAAKSGHGDLVTLLFEHNADINQTTTDDGATPVYIAACNGHVECLELLLEHNADPNLATTTDGRTPAFVAAQEGHAECLELQALGVAIVRGCKCRGLCTIDCRCHVWISGVHQQQLQALRVAIPSGHEHRGASIVGRCAERATSRGHRGRFLLQNALAAVLEHRRQAWSGLRHPFSTTCAPHPLALLQQRRRVGFAVWMILLKTFTCQSALRLNLPNWASRLDRGRDSTK